MKNYDELTKDLLARRDCYIADQKRKRKTALRAASSAACVCLVALLGFGVWKSGMFEAKTPVASASPIHNSDNDRVAQQTPNTGADISQTQNTPAPPNNADTQDQIHFQEIEALPNTQSKMFIALMTGDFISMTRDEINAYYGVDIFPAVPDDLEIKTQRFGIYKRKATGDVYYDGNRIEYLNADSSRGVSVNVDKDGMPFDFSNLFADIQTRSVINGVEVGIGQTPYGELYAEFKYQNTGFRIFTHGLTAKELLGILKSIIE
ncbi:MAG: hypothetical protein IKK00_01195 [Oscillospiraceae bacterium]|nr:hypothetical protein [Oscillospiraceae bacterium]